MQAVIKKDHSLGGGLLSQLCQQTRVMDALPLINLRNLLSRRPRSVLPLNKPLGRESMYYRRRKEEESRYFVTSKED